MKQKFSFSPTPDPIRARIRILIRILILCYLGVLCAVRPRPIGEWGWKPQRWLISQLLLFLWFFSALQIGSIPGWMGCGLMFLARLAIYIHIFADWQSIGHGRCIRPFPGSNLVRTAYGNGFRGSRPLSTNKRDIYI